MDDVIRLFEVVIPPLVTLILGIWGGKAHEKRKARKAPKVEEPKP